MTERTRKDPMLILWASAHRNVLTQIAEEVGCTPQFCHYVLYGLRKSRDYRVERRLRELGAPIRWKP